MKALLSVRTFLLFFVCLFFISFFQKDLPPQEGSLLPSLLREPLQAETQKSPFEAAANNFVYRITPLYDYEFYGLVTSFTHSSSFADYYHEQWKDYLNTTDFSMVWGANVKSGIYRKIMFRSDAWTGAYRGSLSDLSKFKSSAFANNHLLSDDPIIRKTIKSIRRWDQIFLKGYLVKYALKGSEGWRGSSVTREDTGNGACEVIYVTDFRILKRANTFWYFIYRLSLGMVFLCLALSFVSYYKRLKRPLE